MYQKSIKLFTITISMLTVLSVSNSALAVPLVEKIGKSAITKCPTVAPTAQVYHSDKIVFMLGEGTLQPQVAADFAVLNALPRLTEFDIKIQDDPTKVADIKAKVLFFLGAADSLENRNLLRISQVTYATAVCPKAP